MKRSARRRALVRPGIGLFSSGNARTANRFIRAELPVWAEAVRASG
jgi:hypothetical protein